MLGVLASDAGASNLFTENLWPVDFLRVTDFGSQSNWAPFDLQSAVATVARGDRLLLAAGVGARRGQPLLRADGTRERLRALWPIGVALAALLVIGAAWHASGLFADAALGRRVRGAATC